MSKKIIYTKCFQKLFNKNSYISHHKKNINVIIICIDMKFDSLLTIEVSPFSEMFFND